MQGSFFLGPCILLLGLFLAHVRFNQCAEFQGIFHEKPLLFPLKSSFSLSSCDTVMKTCPLCDLTHWLGRRPVFSRCSSFRSTRPYQRSCDLFLTSAQRPQCPQCPTIAQRSQDATGEGGAMANGDRSRQRASQRSALTMQIHDAPACHNRNTTFAPPCMGPPRDSQFCGIERGRFRRMPDGDYSARRETSHI